MCSFAKFLALGLIASEGRGPVFAEAKLLEEKYQYIVGKASDIIAQDADTLRMQAVCVKMSKAYLQETGSVLKDAQGATVPAKCTIKQFDDSKKAMLTVWKNKATQLGLPSRTTWALDTKEAATNIKKAIIEKLQTDLKANPELTHDYYKRINDLQAKKKAEEEAAAKKKAEEEAAAKKKAEEKAQKENETVGGVFGVLAGLAIAFVALLFSPCFQYDFKNHAFDWEKNYDRPAYYEELDGSAHDWRNETNQFLGLPKEPSISAGKVDSSKASSSALTVVPVVFVAGSAFAIARGLKKRRAQKKAKRASRAQVQVYEEL